MSRVHHTKMLFMFSVNCMNVVILIYVSTVVCGVQMVSTVTIIGEIVVGAFQEEKIVANVGNLMTARPVNQIKGK